MANKDHAERDWITVKEATSRYPFGRSTTFDLIRENKIKSASLKKPGAIRGRRVIYAPSVDEYLHSLAE